MSTPHRKPLWKLVLLAGVAFAVLSAVVLGAFAWWFGGQVDRRIAAIRAAGDPASIADIKFPKVAADENAAAVLASLDDELNAFANDHGRFFKTPIGAEYEEVTGEGAGPTSEQLAAIQSILDKHAALSSGLSKAAACPQYAPVGVQAADSRKMLESQLDRISYLRTAARFLRWQMEVLTAQGKAAQAVERGIEILKLARLAENEPTINGYLVSIAVRGSASVSLYDALAVGAIPPELRAALDAELNHVETPGRLGRAMRTERAYAIDSFRAMSQQSNVLATGIARMLLARQRNGVLDYFDEFLKVADAPWYIKRAQFATSAVNAPAKYGPMAAQLAPAFQASYDAHNRDIAIQRSLRVFSALRQFAEAHGREARDLAELKLPAGYTLDPFDGKPLRLKSTPEGWIVYSIGRDEKDDGGDLKQLNDYGVGPRKYRD